MTTKKNPINMESNRIPEFVKNLEGYKRYVYIQSKTKKLFSDFLAWKKQKNPAQTFLDKKLEHINPNYFNTDLSILLKFLCRRDMTVGDIDIVQWDYKKKVVRFIESKQYGEEQNKSQRDLYDFLGQIKIDDYSVETYKVTGNLPFLGMTKITNLQTGEEKRVNFQELIDFLNIK